MIRSMRVLALVMCALATGCSIAWRVEPQDFDGGLDAGLDAGEGGVPDDADLEGGTDSGTDAGPCANPPRFERVCAPASGDEDCDGLFNCNDYDCSTSLDCCGAGAALFTTARFNSGTLPSGWTWMPASQGAIPQSQDRIHTFGTSGQPRGVRVNACLPIDLGTRVTANLTASGAACPATGPCASWASLVLTAAPDIIPGMELSDELQVRVYSDGFAEIRQAGAVLASSRTLDVRFGTRPIAVDIELTPGVDTDGLAYVFATVSLTQDPGGGMPVISWPGDAFRVRPTIPREYLVGAGLGCAGARGLFLAIEGIGAENTVDDVGVTRFACANPSHFQLAAAVGTEIDASDVGGAANWTGGGLGSPAITSFFGSDTDTIERWELLYDASNRERTLEGRDDVHYSIGGAFTVIDPAGITGWTGRRAGAPLLGLNPPDCLAGVAPPEGCANLRSFREPGIFVPVDERLRVRLPGAGTGLVVYAREAVGMPGAFDIAGTRVSLSGDGAVVDEPAAIVARTGCTSVRDPILLPTRPASTEDLVVLYTCEGALGTTPTIRAARLSDWEGTVTPVEDPVLTAADLGPVARNGLRGADGAAFFVDHAPVGWGDEDEVVWRIWLVTQDRDAPTLSFAEGIAPVGELPELRPYAANPVLTSDDPLLGECPTDGCDLESVAVARIANSPNRVRLLISRTPEGDSAIRHVLVPLEQVWPAL